MTRRAAKGPVPRNYPALMAYLAAQTKAPFAWGTHDCVTFAAGAVKAQTGRNVLKGLGKWSSEAEAEAAISARINLEAAISSILRPVPPAHAHRGDVAGVTIGNRFVLGVVTGDLVVVLGEDKLRRLPRRFMTHAWSAD